MITNPNSSSEVLAGRIDTDADRKAASLIVLNFHARRAASPGLTNDGEQLLDRRILYEVRGHRGWRSAASQICSSGPASDTPRSRGYDLPRSSYRLRPLPRSST